MMPARAKHIVFVSVRLSDNGVRMIHAMDEFNMTAALGCNPDGFSLDDARTCV